MGYGSIGKGKLWERGTSRGELSWEAGTQLHTRVSAQSVGSQAIWLGSVMLPPNGGRTKAHLHEDHETAIYLISGDEVELWTGERLEHREIA